MLIDSQVETTSNLMSDEEEDAEAGNDSDGNDQGASSLVELSAAVAGNASVADSFS